MRALALAVVLFAFGRRNVFGQDTARAAVPTGVVDGLVADTALRPLAGAAITILRTAIHVETGASGRFRIIGVPAGQYILIVRHLGHRPSSALIEVSANDTTRLSYTLEAAVTVLEKTVVVEQRLSSRLLEFEQRRKLGEGQFMDQAQIEARDAIMTGDLFRLWRGITLSPGNMIISTRGSVHELTPTAEMSVCASEVYVDGVHMPRGTPTDRLPVPKEIAGIEVYPGPATVPRQYAGGFARCGVVLIWTR
jgi:hypothetical protein